VTLFFKGILCNIFVCLAVWIGFAARTIVDKVVGILLPISAFVACGFEHCVANMFFLPMGLLAKTAGYTAFVDASALDWGGIAANISAATLGNIVGGAIFVGLAYWFVYAQRKDRA
ncbi:MAG: formate/nitrite transporter family protein, partial [Slackia sp.]|nr:formate/nitrite transporter family protein [Slackia sp.]